nr:leucyl/phenylalanyl-tRNA--protein transferase [Chiayiivirga flava]
MRLPRLSDDPDAPFPPVDSALHEPDGLLAFGGDLQPRRLLNAYRHGIFPWYSDDEPILWWSPDPRCVFDTGRFALPRRFRRTLRGSTWTVTFDRAFAQVVAACATAPRAGQRGTWITEAMQAAYGALHRLGHAHSAEVWADGQLAGGLYGVAVGGVFCGESMFSARSGGSKVALAAICRVLAGHGVDLLDAQVPNPHLARLGAQPMARSRYLHHLRHAEPGRLPVAPWCDAIAPFDAASLA